jgi:hypothetical protein
MTSNDDTLAGLRRRLFETIDGVRGGTIALDKARAIGELAQVITNTAKVEVDFLRATQTDEGSGFIVGSDKPHQDAPPNGIVGIVQHRLK